LVHVIAAGESVRAPDARRRSSSARRAERYVWNLAFAVAVYETCPSTVKRERRSARECITENAVRHLGGIEADERSFEKRVRSRKRCATRRPAHENALAPRLRLRRRGARGPYAQTTADQRTHYARGDASPIVSAAQGPVKRWSRARRRRDFRSVASATRRSPRRRHARDERRGPRRREKAVGSGEATGRARGDRREHEPAADDGERDPTRSSPARSARGELESGIACAN